MYLTVTLSQAAGMIHWSPLPTNVNVFLFPDGLVRQLQPTNISVHKPCKDHLKLK